MSTFSSANIKDGLFLLKERTHRIKITYSRNFYALIRQLANLLLYNCRTVVYISRTAGDKKL